MTSLTDNWAFIVILLLLLHDLYRANFKNRNWFLPASVVSAQSFSHRIRQLWSL